MLLLLLACHVLAEPQSSDTSVLMNTIKCPEIGFYYTRGENHYNLNHNTTSIDSKFNSNFKNNIAVNATIKSGNNTKDDLKRDTNDDTVDENDVRKINHEDCFLCLCKRTDLAVCVPRKSWKCDLSKTRKRRSASGLSDLFEMGRNLFTMKEPTNEAPVYKDGQKVCNEGDSHTIGCPPHDWCEGCKVCDCEAHGHWKCETVKFCSPSSNNTIGTIQNINLNQTSEIRVKNTTTTSVKRSKKTDFTKKREQKDKRYPKKYKKELYRHKSVSKNAKKQPNNKGKTNSNKYLSAKLKGKVNETLKIIKPIKKSLNSTVKIINAARIMKIRNNRKLNNGTNLEITNDTKSNLSKSKSAAKVKSRNIRTLDSKKKNKMRSKRQAVENTTDVNLSVEITSKSQVDIKYTSPAKSVNDSYYSYSVNTDSPIAMKYTDKYYEYTIIAKNKINSISNNEKKMVDLSLNKDTVLKLINDHTSNMNEMQLISLLEEQSSYNNSIIRNSNNIKNNKLDMTTRRTFQKVDIFRKMDLKRNPVTKLLFHVPKINVNHHFKINDAKTTSLDNFRNVFDNLMNGLRDRSNTRFSKKQGTIFYIRNFLKSLFDKNEKRMSPVETKISTSLDVSKTRILQAICNTFGPCDINVNNRAILFKNMNLLHFEAMKVLKSIKVIKGLLKLLNFTNMTGAVNNTKDSLKVDIQKLRAILKGNHLENNANISQVQITQIDYIKSNVQTFAQSIRKFTLLMNETVHIVNKKYYNNTDVPSNLVKNKVKYYKRQYFNKNDKKQLKDRVDALKLVILKYSNLQKNFMHKMFNVLNKFQDHLSYKSKPTNINNRRRIATSTTTASPEKRIEKFSSEIIKNLSKLTRVVNMMSNKTVSKRFKRYIKNNEEVEYMMNLMERFMSNNYRLNTPPADGIDVLVDAISNVPNIHPILETKPLPIPVLNYTSTLVTRAPYTLSKGENLAILQEESNSLCDSDNDKSDLNVISTTSKDELTTFYVSLLKAEIKETDNHSEDNSELNLVETEKDKPYIEYENYNNKIKINNKKKPNNIRDENETETILENKSEFEFTDSPKTNHAVYSDKNYSVQCHSNDSNINYDIARDTREVENEIENKYELTSAETKVEVPQYNIRNTPPKYKEFSSGKNLSNKIYNIMKDIEDTETNTEDKSDLNILETKVDTSEVVSNQNYEDLNFTAQFHNKSDRYNLKYVRSSTDVYLVNNTIIPSSTEDQNMENENISNEIIDTDSRMNNTNAVRWIDEPLRENNETLSVSNIKSTPTNSSQEILLTDTDNSPVNNKPIAKVMKDEKVDNSTLTQIEVAFDDKQSLNSVYDVTEFTDSEETDLRDNISDDFT